MGKKRVASVVSHCGTKFSLFISTAVILGVAVTYLTIHLLNRYSFDNITKMNAEAILNQSLAATKHEIKGFVTSCNQSIHSLQKIMESSSFNGDNDTKSLVQLLVRDLLNKQEVAGVMFGKPDGEFTFIKRHSDVQDGSAKKITNGFALKTIRYQPERSVSITFLDGKTLNHISGRDEIDIQNDNYDPRERVWYNNAVKSGKVVWSKPYIFFTSLKPGLTVSAPVMKNGELLGVVGIDIELDSLTEFIHKLTEQTFDADFEKAKEEQVSTPEAFVYMTPKDNHTEKEAIVIAHTIEELSIPQKAAGKVELMRLQDFPVNALRISAVEFTNSGKENKFGVLPLKGGQKFYYMFNSCFSAECALNLSTGFVIPYSLISGNITSFARNIQYILILTGLICLFAGLYVARLFSKPINQLSELAAKVAEMDFSHLPEIKRTPFYEINTAASTFNNMWHSIKEYRDKNIELSDQLKLSYRETIIRLASAAEYKDKDTHDHLTRISEYSSMIARALELSETEIENIRFAAPMHDIGKIGIPDAILLKPGKYTPEEFDVMKNHSRYGYDLLQPPESEIMRLSAVIALGHHEKYNGKGYPIGLNGEEIPLAARIVSLADVYDALRSKRCYKDAMSHEKVMAIIREERGEHFCPKVVDAFLSIQEEIFKLSCKINSADSQIPLKTTQNTQIACS